MRLFPAALEGRRRLALDDAQAVSGAFLAAAAYEAGRLRQLVPEVDGGPFVAVSPVQEIFGGGLGAPPAREA